MSFNNSLWMVLFTMCLAVTVLAIQPAFACTCDGWPFTNELRDGGGRIPVNADGVGWFLTQAEYWETPSHQYDEDEVAEFVTVTDLEAGSAVEFSVKNVGWHFFLIKPRNWAVGKRYRVSTEVPILKVDGTPAPQEDDTDSIEFVVANAFEPSLFQITATEPEFVRSSVDANSGCTSEIDVVKRFVKAEFPGHALDMRLFHFETWVDDRPWRWKFLDSLCEVIVPGRFAGEFRTYASCDESEEWSRELHPEGEFEVRMSATLPGTNLSWESDPITVSLECGADDPGRANEEASGCSISSLRKSNVSLFVAIALVAMRRKRRRHSRDG